MSRREIILKMAIIFIILAVGFILRVESANLYGVPAEEKAFYQDQNGLPYMYELDSYYNYRLTKDYLDHGYMGDTIINGQPWDLHYKYPPGMPILYPPLIIYVSALFYKFASLFITIPLLTAVFWLPAFIGPLCGIPAYLMVKRITNNYGGFFAGILAVTSPLYFERTVPGFFDTDMFNVLLPLLIVFFLYEAVQSEDTRLKILYSILSAFSMFIFSMAWNGWIYIFFVILLTSLIYIIACRIKKIQIKDFYLIFGIFLVVSLGLIIIFRGLQDFLYTVTLPIQFIRGFEAINPWPNINVSVNELQTPMAEELMGGIGNMLLLMGIFGIFMILRILLDEKMKKKFLNKMNWFLCLLLIIWFLISLYAITNGGRFILLVVSPLIISSGIFVGILVEYLKAIKNREKLIKALSLFLILFLVIPPIVNAYYTFEILRPNVDDDLRDASQWISYNTPKDTVVIAPLWSYNHFFTVFADRPVVGTQDTPREYWIYKAFSTSNQSLSYGIFRMLSTSGDEAYKTLNMSTNSTAKTVEILDKILGVDNETANEILTKDYNMTKNKAQEVLKYTHPNKTRDFVLLTFDDMVDAGYWTFYFGEWDFYNMEPRGYTYSVGKITVKNNTIKSSNGVVMDLKSGNMTWKNKMPYCGIIITEGKIKKIYYDENSYFCVILSMDDYKSIIINKKFENSLYTKLLFEKSNSTLFKPIYKNEKVIVWKATDL